MTANINIGIAGWSYDDWKGIVYPSPCPDPLRYVSQFVDCIEINSSFYHLPSAQAVVAWQEKTAWKPGFYFTAKLHRSFTHEATLEPCTVQAFHEGFKPLLESQQLKHLLVQFKYDFDYTTEREVQLLRIVEHFSETFAIALELRHRSWQSPKALETLEQLPVTVCNLDYPLAQNSFDHTSTFGSNGYFRLHGRNAEAWFRKCSRNETYDYYYNAAELGEIKQRVLELSQAFEVLTVITNNHYRGAELANALELKALLTDATLDIPEGLLDTYPQLAHIARNKRLFDDR